MSQQAAADAVYHDYLQGLSKEELDFVRNDGNWPAIRTSTNKTGAPNDRPRKKGDWHSQRSAFVIVMRRDRVVNFEKSNAFVTINVNMICGRTQLIFDMVSTDVATTLIAILGKESCRGCLTLAAI